MPRSWGTERPRVAVVGSGVAGLCPRLASFEAGFCACHLGVHQLIRQRFSMTGQVRMPWPSLPACTGPGPR